MLDKAVFHIPVDASLVDVREDGKYCIFGFDLLDLDLRIASHSVYKDEEGNVRHKVLNHPYSKLPTSFTEMAFKFFHEGYYYPYVELKCSPAKILQGHNVYGSDWLTDIAKPKATQQTAQTTQTNVQTDQTQSASEVQATSQDQEQTKYKYDINNPYNQNYEIYYEIQQRPRLAGCIISKRTCSCYTQQATKIDMSQSDCKRYMSGDKPFDYFTKEQERHQTQERPTASPVATGQQQANDFDREYFAKMQQAKQEGLL